MAALNLNPIDQIVPWVTLSVIAIIVLTLVVLRRVFLLPYIRVMEQREQDLESAESVLEEAQRVLDEARPEAERVVAEAREKADEMMRAAREEIDTQRRAAIDAAMDDAAAMLQEGRAGIAESRESELAELRTQAIECVALACERLLGSSDDGAAEAAVDRLFARRVH